MPMLAAPKWSSTSAPKKVKSVLLSLSLFLFSCHYSAFSWHLWWRDIWSFLDLPVLCNPSLITKWLQNHCDAENLLGFPPLSEMESLLGARSQTRDSSLPPNIPAQQDSVSLRCPHCSGKSGQNTTASATCKPAGRCQFLPFWSIILGWIKWI